MIDAAQGIPLLDLSYDDRQSWRLAWRQMIRSNADPDAKRAWLLFAETGRVDVEFCKKYELLREARLAESSESAARIEKEYAQRWAERKAKRAERQARNAAKSMERKAKAWPEHKQRRSVINWFELVPAKVAREQVRYEKGATVAAMRRAEMTFAAIGTCFGVSAGRAIQLFQNFGRMKSPPVERYLQPPPAIELMAA